MRYAVFGLGNSVYSDHYNTIGKNCDKFLFKLSAERFLPLHLGDENEDLENDFNTWNDKLLSAINSNNDGDGVVLNNEVNETVAETESEDEEEDDEEEGTGSGDDLGMFLNNMSMSVTKIVSLYYSISSLVDLEDLGTVMKKAKSKDQQKGPKEMLNPTLRQSLTKQGYKLIGSHSGVKICRWTKAMLRGRGGCYKHSFYGIESHRCMETTPRYDTILNNFIELVDLNLTLFSLACANKCVFCWRHHSNPVGTEWKWSMDPPDMLVEGALQNHYKMIKQMKGACEVLKNCT